MVESALTDGIWDVVDGLQRLSTIFEFVGILQDEDKKKLPPLTLEATPYLTSLKDRRWEDNNHPDQSLTTTQRLLISTSFNNSFLMSYSLTVISE
jgi:hypothetical protein